VIRLTEEALLKLRERLRTRGERPSLVLIPANSRPEILEAIDIAGQYAVMSEALYLVMAADNKVRNVERDVFRGALRALSSDRIRSFHIESLLANAAKNLVEHGQEERLNYVIERLRHDTARAEITFILAAAVAAADGEIVPTEEDVLHKLSEGLGIDEQRANQLLSEFGTETT
jgi:tellurite resistance protein